MRKMINRLTDSQLGRGVYWPAQALLHLARRLRHPELPPDQTITRVSYRHREFSILHRRWCSDGPTIEQCFNQAQYDFPMDAQGILVERIFREIVAAGKRPLIVDCGANIGASVLWFAARYPEAHIIAVEPSPANFAFLAKNCANLEVDLRQAGIGPIDGTAWMSDPESGWGCTTNQSRQGIAVDIISIASLLASKPPSTYSPFLLKVDIEGAEKSLFSGPDSVLDQFPVIFMEPHDRLFPGQKTSVEFFRFHAQAEREFAMSHENIASIRVDRLEPLEIGGFERGGAHTVI